MLSTLNHYVKEKLAVAVDVRTMVREKYCEFYAEFCDQIQAELYSPSESTALNEIHTEIDNIRAAWGLMLDANHWDLLNKYLEALIAYHSVFGNYYQGRELFNIALIKLKKLNLPEYELLQAALLRNLMWMEFLRGFSSDTLTAMEECIDIFQKYNASWEIARTLYYMSEINRTAGNLVDAKNLIEQTIALMQSNSSAQSNQGSSIIAYCQAALGRILINLRDYEQAKRYLKISLETQQQAGTIHGTITPLLGLARLAFLQGEFLQARDLYHQALDCAIKINDHHSIMVIHNNLSDVYEAIANVPKSQHHLQTALKLCEETGDRRLIAVIMNNVAYQQLKYDDQPTESLRTYHECLKIFSELGDLRGIAYTSYDVSKAYIKISSLDEAWNSCLRALNTALTLDNIPMALHALHGFANYFAETGQSGRAYILCDLIISHPEVESDTQKRAIVSKAMLEASLSSGSIRSYRSTAGSSDLQDIINQILSEKPRTTNN
jgi:tetratricopeptide (TPR) repeat protein